MPGRDGTGPVGAGSMTGRAWGFVTTQRRLILVAGQR